MTRSKHSQSASVAGFFISVFLLLGAAAAAYLLWPSAGREPPMQSVAVDVPLPEIPAPPGTLPDSGGEIVPPAP